MFLPLFVISVKICVHDDIGMVVVDIDDFGVAAADSVDDKACLQLILLMTLVWL